MNECCHNVVEMFSYNFLRQLFLNFPGILISNFSQLSPNVVETLLQPYIVNWVIEFYPYLINFSCKLKINVIKELL